MDVDAAAPAQAAVGSRVNLTLFKQLPLGAPVRVGGRLAGASEACSLLTTDGGSLRVQGAAEVGVADGTFVELVGTKAGDAELCVTSTVTLPTGEVDFELWDEAVKLMHMPQLKDMFVPMQSQQF